MELIATVNGTTFYVLVENLSRERVFGDAGIRISGRGRSAALAAPYAPVIAFANTKPRSARQLMNDVLTFNGIPLGWDVDWALTDWLVPTGVFAKQSTWNQGVDHHRRRGGRLPAAASVREDAACAPSLSRGAVGLVGRRDGWTRSRATSASCAICSKRGATRAAPCGAR